MEAGAGTVGRINAPAVAASSGPRGTADGSRTRGVEIRRMPTRYEPKDHIQHLEIAPRADSVLDQREVTVQTYLTSVPFDHETLDACLSGAWLAPAIRLGVFARNVGVGRDELHVVLGLQGEISVRAYDFDERRPLWFSWQDLIVDTMAIRYVRDESGFIRFTTAGGGLRITDEKLADFNSAFLKIPRAAVQKLQFDLSKLRDLCFNRFADRLYMLRFSNPSGTEYRSIDHASFQSRRYIDPAVERLREVRSDAHVKIESFDSDVTVTTDDLASPVEVRFAVRGLSGALRLRFQKVTYKAQLKAGPEQTQVFYRLVDEAVRSILDADYYARRRLSLAELEKNPEFPEFADTAPYRELFRTPEARKEFFSDLHLGAPRQLWLPHLRAITELLAVDGAAPEIPDLAAELARRDPGQAVRLLSICRTDAGLSRLGQLLADVLHGELQGMPAATRAHAEESLLAWMIDHEEDGWDIDPESGVVSARKLRWRLEDLDLEVLPAVLWKLIGILHARLKASDDDVCADLRRYAWCMAAAKALPTNHSRTTAALRLVAAGRVPRSVREAVRVLREPVSDLRALDDALLDQFGLPPWPCFSASRADGGIALANDGIASALAVTLIPAGALFSDASPPTPFDLPAGESILLPVPGAAKNLRLEFEKLGTRRRASVPVSADSSATASEAGVRTLSSAISRKRVAAQRAYRANIDPGGVVVGSSPALLKVFEDIHHANAMHDGTAALILGERGVGKTHIAQLLHDSSARAKRPFKAVNAGGSGGDLNIQRGEWIGYGKGHGIAGIDRNGSAGHLMEVNRGTLFVDELAALSQDLQVIFLSVLERRDVSKVGGEAFAPDVRCIFATNADVDDLVERGVLRADLLARIPVRIHIPPLRERRGDVLLLAKHFAGAGRRFTDRALLALVRHEWPDNVRELQNKVAAAVAQATIEGAASVDVAHLDLPAPVSAAAKAPSDDDCERELWRLADETARNEGYAHGTGLQRRAGEIMGVGEAQASKMYRGLGLADAPAA